MSENNEKIPTEKKPLENKLIENKTIENARNNNLGTTQHTSGSKVSLNRTHLKTGNQHHQRSMASLPASVGRQDHPLRNWSAAEQRLQKLATC